MKHSATVKLSRFAFEALSGGAWSSSLRAQDRMIGAIHCYLRDKGSGRAGWRFPGVLSEERADDYVVVEMRIDDDLWRAFENEADDQGVSVQQMSEHAALYLAAEFNAGHITQRMLDDLDEVA